jgi:phage terminase small subunit
MARAPTNEHGLTDRQESFIREYVQNGGQGEKAAIEAGYGEGGARSRASENLRLPLLQVRMETLCRELMSGYAPEVIKALAKLAVSAQSETVRASAGATLLDRTGYKAPVLLEISDHRTQQDVDKELAILLGLDEPGTTAADPAKPTKH